MTYNEFKAAIAVSDYELSRMRREHVDDSSDAWTSWDRDRHALEANVRRKYRASIRGTVSVGLDARDRPAVSFIVRDETRLQESSWRVDDGEIDPTCHHATDFERASVRKVYETVGVYTYGGIDALPPSDTDGRHPWTEPGYEPRAIS